MNTLTATELDRHGMSAVEEALKKGPVHIIQGDRPQAVILSEADYQRLCRLEKNEQAAGTVANAWEFLLNHPGGSTSPKDIHDRIEQERDAWNSRNG